MRAFKVHLKIAFSDFDPSWNQTDLLTSASRFCRDIHFQDFEDLSSFRYKIKFAMCHFGSEKIYIDYTYNVFLFFFCFFFLFFYLYSYGLTSGLTTISNKSKLNGLPFKMVPF